LVFAKAQECGVHVMISRILLKFFVVVVCAISFLPNSVSACAVCFGKSDGPAAQGLNAAIFLMLAVIGSVLGSILSFIFYLRKKSKMVYS
jgi:hypothetical protein